MELLVAIVVTVLNFLLGFFVYLKNTKGDTHRHFLFLTVVIGLWTLTNYFSLHAPDEATTLFWIRVVMVVTSFLGPAILLLVASFPRTHSTISGKWENLILYMGFITSVLAMSPFMFTSVSVVAGVITPQPGPALPVFAIQFFGTLIAGFGILIKKFRRAHGLEKTQLKYLLAGIISSFTLLTVTNFVFVALLQISSFVMFGPIFTLIFAGTIAYAIVKHRFLDLSLVIVRSLGYILVMGIFIAVYSVSVFYLQSLLSGQEPSMLLILTSAAVTIGVVSTFEPLKRWIQHKTETIFYRRDYDRADLLKLTSKISTSILSLTKLVDGFIKVLSGEMKISAMAIVIGNDNKKVRLYGSDALALQPTSDTQLQQFKHDFQVYEAVKNALGKARDQIIIFDEIDESVIKSIMRERQIAVILPLIVNNDYLGCMLLQEKQTGTVYTSEDIKTLQLIAPQIAIALRNALSFEEIKQFNVVLEDEVLRATSKLRRANKSLKELDRLKDDFVSIASHELRTPMTAIKSYIWMALSGKGGQLSKKQRYYLERSYLSTDRLIKLVNDMLNISRIESHRIALTVGKVDLQALVTEIVAEVKSRTDELDITVEVADHCTDRTGKSLGAVPPVIADSDKLSEVVMNLLGNSLKFTPKKGKITISFRQEEDMLITSVTDTGVGMTPDTISKLFQKFGLIKGSYKTNQNASQGTGLGLFISRAVVELHKGEIWATSPGEGKGSSFCFSLKKYTQEDFKKLEDEFKKREDVGIIRTRSSFWV